MTLDKDDRWSLPAGPESVSRKYLLSVIGFLAVLTAVRLAILASGVLNLSGDEAHYWEWSRRLDWCYYSKPPGVALLVRVGTFLFGDTELGVRFMAPVLSLLSSVVMFLLGTRLYGRKAGLIAAVLLQLVPMVSAFGLGMTPDTPLDLLLAAVAVLPAPGLVRRRRLRLAAAGGLSRFGTALEVRHRLPVHSRRAAAVDDAPRPAPTPHALALSELRLEPAVLPARDRLEQPPRLGHVPPRPGPYGAGPSLGPLAPHLPRCLWAGSLAA